MLTKKEKPRVQSIAACSSRSMSIDIPLSASIASTACPLISPFSKFECFKNNNLAVSTVGRVATFVRTPAAGLLTPTYPEYR
jgi:hypothetical protein